MFNVSTWPIQFASPLGASAWAALLAVPAGIVALYFLKLRRRPVQVSSTLLWRRSLEDLHVNSLFQRLRKNLLLALQLLAVILAMLALLGPRMKGSAGRGQRTILAIDNSASMSATDVDPSRLDRAKREAIRAVDAMKPDDLAMVLSFADRARVVASYSGNRRQLRDRINAIRPTQATTSLRDALVVAAGLADPAKDFASVARENSGATGPIPTEYEAPKLLIFTDGGFPDVSGVSLGHLDPEVVVIGPPVEASPKPPAPSDNLAVLALQAGRNDDRPDLYQVYGRAHNYRGEDVATEARLFRRDPAHPEAPGTLIDAVSLTISAKSDQAFKFDVADPGPTGADLEVRLDVRDALPLDDHAYVAIAPPRKAQVLVVSEGDKYLLDALQTPALAPLADVTVVAPEASKAEAVTREVAAGRYDLVIYDRHRPEAAPAATALYLGVLPPGKAYDEPKEYQGPIVLDWNVSHPLMQYIRDLGQVRILKAVSVDPPPGSTRLIDSDRGPLAFVAPREGYSDVVVGFALVDGTALNTDWVRYYSFPLFLYNAVRVLGNARDSAGGDLHAPGQSVTLRADSGQSTLTVTPPPGAGSPAKLNRAPQGTFVFNDATTTGFYQARWGESSGTTFAVNLFDPRESDLASRGLDNNEGAGLGNSAKIQLGVASVTASRRTVPARRELWKPLALVALGVVLLEWYIYNRRVYL